MSEQSERERSERGRKELLDHQKRMDGETTRRRASGLGFGRVVWMIAVGILLADIVRAVVNIGVVYYTANL